MATPIPQNQAAFTLREVASATGGELHDDPEQRVLGVHTDSRQALGGGLFVALRGENFDGHRFLTSAVAQGAAAVLIARGNAAPEGVAHVVVDDTLVALGDLAHAHRRRWAGLVVAIAGSAGKTTTRSATSAVLEAVHPGAVHSTVGNLNNRVGVPMVLLGLEPHHRVAVVEVGTNHRGEVATLARILEPDIGVVTLVDVEHAEGIGSLDDIESEEGDLLALVARGGTAIGNGDDPRVVRQLCRSTAGRRLTYGTGEHAAYRIVRRSPTGLGSSRITVLRPAGTEVLLDCPLVGLPGALALTGALAVAETVAGAALDAPAISAAVERVGVGEQGRLAPVELADGTVVIDDSYNANPGSVLASVRAAAEIASARSARLVLVLGEMRELGRGSEAYHRDVGARVALGNPAALIGVCGDARRFVEAALTSGIEAAFCMDADAAASLVLERVRPGDVVLVKASRGVRAERVVDALVRERGRRAS